MLPLIFAFIAVFGYQVIDYGSPSQTEDHDDHSNFIVVDIPGKGMGAIAARDIKVLVMQNQI